MVTVKQTSIPGTDKQMAEQVNKDREGPPPPPREAAPAIPRKGGCPRPGAGWRGQYLQGVVGSHGPRPLHHGGRGRVQQRQGVIHYGKGGKEKSPG